MRQSPFRTRDWWGVSVECDVAFAIYHPWLMDCVIGISEYYIIDWCRSREDWCEQYEFLKFNRKALLGGQSWKEFDVPNSVPPYVADAWRSFFRNIYKLYAFQTATLCVIACSLFVLSFFPTFHFFSVLCKILWLRQDVVSKVPMQFRQ